MLIIQLPLRVESRKIVTDNRSLVSTGATEVLNHTIDEDMRYQQPVYVPASTLIGGISAGGDQWKTTASSMNSGDKSVMRTKKLWQTGQDQISPITGEVFQNYSATNSKQVSANNRVAYGNDDDPDAGIHPLIKKLKDKLMSRGSSGIVGLQIKFKVMDDDGSKSLNIAEFRKAMRETVPDFSDSDISTLFRMFGMCTYVNIANNTFDRSYNHFCICRSRQ